VEVIDRFPPICKNCSDEEGRAVFMELFKSGVKVRFGYYSGCFYADLWICKRCMSEIIMGYGDTEIFDIVPDFDYSEEGGRKHGVVKKV